MIENTTVKKRTKHDSVVPPIICLSSESGGRYSVLTTP